MNMPKVILWSSFSLLSLIILVGCDRVYKINGNEVSLIKAASPSEITEAGQVITYTYIVTFNNDNPIPPVPNSLGGDSEGPLKIAITDAPLDGPVTCLVSTLYAHESTTCTAQYTVTERDIMSGCIT